ncbi:hypothetical protein BCR36DRAFT_407675 [Piromyces finnis]|uniref:Uncharacterized protein n=1 Tax=Piromyces finnis TaxID=1754191 RepID=A0A1Y1UHG5_9FUNG|nr:hypothetical protein BCR36DRAFT_407675 [Piromyces finnis]|eukprot:ORX37472.1 hypothetical protein BCR36DRAFT_407675 [Piromyces finnis]
MIVNTVESSNKTNQATLSIFSPNTLSNGAMSFDIMAPVDGTLVNISVFEADTDRMVHLGQVKATTEYKTYAFDIACDAFIRFNFQDESGEGVEFRLKNILYTTGTVADFNQTYDIITIYATLSIFSPNTLSNGAMSFDIMAPVDGTLVNISVFEADTDRMVHLGQVKATTEYKTYAFDIACDAFIRFNFQDESGEGVEFRLKNIKYTTGPSSVFKVEKTEPTYDIITIYGNEDFSQKNSKIGLGKLIFDIMAPVDGTLVNISVFEADTDRMVHLGQVKATTEYKTYAFDIACDAFIRFNFQDESGEGVEFRLKNIKYTTGPSSVFKIDNSEPVSNEIITIYEMGDQFLEPYENWSWSTTIEYEDGMNVTIEPDFGALSFYSPEYFKKALSDSEASDWNPVKTVKPTEEWTTYTVRVSVPQYNRLNFQDATGKGVEFQIKNIQYTAGSF